jgi:hypothetical protein
MFGMSKFKVQVAHHPHKDQRAHAQEQATQNAEDDDGGISVLMISRLLRTNCIGNYIEDRQHGLGPGRAKHRHAARRFP